MAEPVIAIQINEGSEGAPAFATVDTALRWTGPNAVAGDLSDPHLAPIGDGDDVFFDNAASPNDGELWHDAATDVQITVTGRNTNRNCLRILETGASDGTVDPPELTAYDDAADGVSRTLPTVWLLAGTAGTNNISTMRAVETTTAAGSAGGWVAQVHDVSPQVTGSGIAADGWPLAGNAVTSKVVTATALAASGNKTFQLAAALPDDAVAGQTAFIYQCQYTFV